MLDQAGVMAVATAHLPPQVEPLLPWEAERAVALVAVFGQWLSAGVLVGRRERVRTVLVVSALSAVLFSGLAMVNQLSVVGFKEAAVFGYVATASGLTAAVLCGIRQRWKC